MPLEDALNRLFERTASSVRREKVFVHDAAHELRTPLAVINAQAHLLADSDGATREQAKQMLQAAVARASHVTQQLLRLAQADAAAESERMPLDLMNMARGAMALHADHAVQQNVELDLQGPDHLPMQSDPRAFHKLNYEVKADGRTAARDPILAGRGDDKVSYATAAAAWETDVGSTATNRNAVEPRLGLEYSPRDDLTLSAGAGRHSQPPADEEALALIGNPRLKRVQSNHAVLGVTQRLAEGWSWRAEVYAKTFDDYAVSDPVLNYRNGASGTARGLELLIKKDAAGGRFSGFASVSLSRSRRTVDATGASFPFAFDQPAIATVVGNYKLNDRWQFGAKWTYHTGNPDTPVLGTGLFPDGRVRPIYGSINSECLPAYHRLDLRADAKITPRFSYYIELINAYKRTNVSGYSYSADYRSRKPIEQLSVLPSFGIRSTF